MNIYTKTGDKGITSLFGGKKISKADNLIETYGSIDELNSFLGLIISKKIDKKTKQLLTSIQKDLGVIMSYLAGAKININYLNQQVNIFEQNIDDIQSKLPRINSFILLQGSEISCWFHILRSICRRTERQIVRLFSNNIIIKYFNRLSDLFFVLARLYNKEKELII